MRVGGMDLGEVEIAVGGVDNFVSDNRVGQFVEHIEKRLGCALNKGNMATAIARLGEQRGRNCRIIKIVVDGKDADHVGAEVGHKDVFLCGIDNGLVRIVFILTLGVHRRSRPVLERGIVGEAARDAAGVTNVERVDAPIAARRPRSAFFLQCHHISRDGR